MIFFAAANTLEKLKEIPPKFWLKLGLAVLAVVIAVTVVRRVLKVNKFILTVIILMACAFTFINWVYHRTEPAFLTPFVDRIAPFLPSAVPEAKH